VPRPSSVGDPGFFRSSDGRIYEGWHTVGGSALVTFVAVGSVVYGFGSIFEPLRNELQWSAFVVSLGFALRSEVGGLAAPLVGFALDHVGPQRVVRIGVLLSAAGVLSLSFTWELWQFFPSVGLIAVGSTAAGGQVGHHAVASWFRTKRARAMSLMTLGGAAGGLFPVIVAIGVEEIGWRQTLRVLAVVILVLGLALSRWVKARPAVHPQPIDGIALASGEPARRAAEWNVPYGEAVRSRAFRQIVTFNIAADFGRLAYLTHLVAFVERDLGASAVGAGTALTVSTLASLIGRVGSGILADRYDVTRVAAFTMVPFAIGALVLAVATDPWHAYAAAVFGGIGFGASIPVRPAMYVEFFGLESFGRVMGIGRLASTTGGFMGGALVGLIVDASDGSYGSGWLIVAGVAAVSVPLMLLVRPPRELQDRHRVSPA